MEILHNPPRSEWNRLSLRALSDRAAEVSATVESIVADVRDGGDRALRDYERRFTGALLDSLEVSADEFDAAAGALEPSLRHAIEAAAANIAAFHSAQAMERPVVVETVPGVTCEQRALPIERVGLYVPGGNSPLFSTVLMLGVPARIAGCDEVVMCTPPQSDGTVHPAILYAARVAGVGRVFKTGGAQAIAAMAVGTETVPRVYKIFGPGNRYVMEAKQQVTRLGVAIDMPAGPSEVMVVADDSADVRFVAADFLSQAEHGPDSQSILLTGSASLADALPGVIEQMLLTLPRTDMMRKSLAHSRIIRFDSVDDIMDFANHYGPEHLIINHRDAVSLAGRVRSAGSVFIGPWTPESAGDYASGTNHTLPTSGYAHAYSGVNLDSFIKKITFQHITPRGVASIGPIVAEMALAEDLHAHRLAMTLRLDHLTEQ